MTAGLLLGAPRAARAYNCGGQMWQTINVSLSNSLAGAMSTYTINTAVPTLNGCDLTSNTQITIIFPGDTNLATITGGTLNGSPVSGISHAGQTLTFTSPVAVSNGAAVAIVLDAVTNASTAGSKTITMSATPVQNGSIGATVSNPYTLTVLTPTRTPTLTPTITLTPTLTSTPTVTATPSLTPTPTLTPTITPVPGLCIGPLVNNPCIPGGGSKKTDCNVEWATTPVPLRNKAGFPKNKLVCYEGDPACDFDANLTNNSCAFHARLCINNHDPRLSACTPSSITTFEVKAPNPSHPKDSADSTNLATLENQAGPGGFGVTVARGVTQVFIGMPNSTPDLCSPAFALQVPLRQTAGGKILKASKRLRIKVNATGTLDKDSIVLECRPSTCGDHVIQGDHETCDDGNRINGDGCDSGCHIEVPPTPTRTFTVAPPSATPTPEPTPIGPTLTPSLTATATLTATPTNTVVSLGTATATPSNTPVPLSRTCTFHPGSGFSQVRVFTSLGITLNVNLTGHQVWNFSAPAGDGTRAMAIPASGTHFDGVIALGLVKVCPRSGGDGTGIIDCNGGVLSGYNTLGGWDHNTTDPPGVEGGDPQDPECDDTFTNPGGLVTSAKIEVGRCSGDLTTHCTSNADCTANGTCGVGRCTGDGTTPCSSDGDCSMNGTCGGYNGDIHPTICNGPLRITQSGPFGAGGMRLNESLFVRILTTTSSPCPADNAPFDATMGDIALSGTITSGNATGTVYDVMDSSYPWPLTTGDLIDGTRCCQSGASAGHFCSANNNCSNMDCVAGPSCTGAAFGCANIDNNILSAGGLSLSIPVLDLVIPGFGDADLVGTLLLVCN